MFRFLFTNKNVQAALWITTHGYRCCLDLVSSSAVAGLPFWHSSSLLAKGPPPCCHPHPPFPLLLLPVLPTLHNSGCPLLEISFELLPFSTYT